MAYVPHGPLGLEKLLAHTPADERQRTASRILADLADRLRPHLPRGTVFFRWDLLLGTTWTLESPEPETFPQPLLPPLKKAVDVQPPNTVILDLRGSEEEILEGMHKKTRYNIRLAEKKGVVIREAEPEELPRWYELYRITSERDKISIHPESYYRGLFSTSADFPQYPVKLWLAEHEGQLLAGIITVKAGDRVTYLYGASSNEGRNLMPAYLLQWKAIQWAKDQGATSYDFFGIPPTGEEGHPMHGLYRFKTGFGGVIHHRLGAWDRVYRLLPYLALSLSEKMRTWYYKVWKKR